MDSILLRLGDCTNSMMLGVKLFDGILSVALVVVVFWDLDDLECVNEHERAGLF